MNYVEPNNTTFVQHPECDKGWHTLIENCHAELLALDPKYKILQIKEKFGGLRYYFQLSTDSLDTCQKADDIVAKYESKSWTTCEICGDEGALRNREWRRVLCDTHSDGAPPIVTE